jgi:hypothetical protein
MQLAYNHKEAWDFRIFRIMFPVGYNFEEHEEANQFLYLGSGENLRVL